MLDLMAFQPSDVFWPVFLDWWDVCDNTWWYRRELLIYLRRHHARDAGPGYLQGDDRAFFDGLPEQIEVFRGCSRARVRGISWTTDREVATGFARGHRGIRVPEPVVACATVSKSAVFAAFTEREENELALDPRRLRGLTLHDATDDA